jgi:hypothetical protein
MIRGPLWILVALFVGGCAPEVSPPAAPPVPEIQAPDFSGVYAPAPFVSRPELTLSDPVPFTDAARALFAEFDPLVGNPRLEDDCVRETMPAVLWLGAPMEITQSDDRVVLRFERGGVVRSIPFGQALPDEAVEPSELGVSVARWDADVLTIETTGLLGGEVITNQGYRLSAQAHLTERYWREPGEMDLQLEVSIDDPVNYTETFTIARVWVWAPDEQVQEWECIDLGTREGDIDIDIDELARQLEQL